MSSIKKLVSQNLRRHRNEKGITQKQLAQLLGVVETTVNRYESGEQNLTIETLQKLSDALAINVIDLFTNNVRQ